MARSPTQQIADLRIDFAVLQERVEALSRDARDSNDDHKTAAGELKELRDLQAKLREENAALRQEIALVQLSVQQLRKEWDDWDRKRWVLVGLFVGAALSFLANLTLVFVRK